MAAYSERIPTGLGHYVYRLWAADGTCLYVGVTGERTPRRVNWRLWEHKRKPWWSEVARIDVASFASPAEAVAEEPRQVAALNPAHNVMLVPHCRHGHEVGRRTRDGGCPECRRQYRAELNRRPEVKAKSAERARRRRALGSRRRPGPGQDALW